MEYLKAKHYDASLRLELTPVPMRMRSLPVHRGYPVPWFVAWEKGEPDFRIMDRQKFARAIRERRCWACGDVLGRFLTFVIGPMCAVTRTTSEPPNHLECARWSAINCPFLSRPQMRRREGGYQEGTLEAAGIPLDRNPGVACLWTARDYVLFKPPIGSGSLIQVGDPLEVEWFAEGRAATRAEVDASITSGFPSLVATVEWEQPERRELARAALEQRRRAVEALWPAAREDLPMPKLGDITQERAARRFHQMAVLERQIVLKTREMAECRAHLKELREAFDGLVIRLRTRRAMRASCRSRSR